MGFRQLAGHKISLECDSLTEIENGCAEWLNCTYFLQIRGEDMKKVTLTGRLRQTVDFC